MSKLMVTGIIADTHDNLDAVYKAVQIFKRKGVELILHGGDIIAPFVAEPFETLDAAFIGVFGNNDGEVSGLKTAFSGNIYRPPHEIELDGKNVLLMHEPDCLEALMRSTVYDVIIYGHTHLPDIRRKRTLVINPGECCGWVEGRQSIVIWDSERDDVEFITL